MPDLDALDNPIWHALGTLHASLGHHHGLARRYRGEVSRLAAVSESSPAALSDLRDLAAPGEVVGVVLNEPMEAGPGWTVMRARYIDQMVCGELRPAPPVEFDELRESDVPAMLALTQATEPGPFARETIRMGRYIGVKDGDRLAAMSGQRMKLPGFTEISAVCTDPAYRGRGYAAGLMTPLIREVQGQGKTAFLHVKTENAGAIRVYERLGFSRRRQVWFMVLKREG